MTDSPTPAPAGTPDFAPSRRADGWSVAAQRAFCMAIAEGRPVEAAARALGLSGSSAYAFRTTAGGAAFAAGWAAAQLAWRQRLADLIVARIVDGQTVTITMPDGSKRERHSYDNRLAMAMLTRLDRLAAPPAPPTNAAAVNVANWVAARRAPDIDTLARDIAPAMDRWFDALEATPEADPRDLAKALTPRRTPAVDPDGNPQDSQHSQGTDDTLFTMQCPIWWCDLNEQLRTEFPPPPPEALGPDEDIEMLSEEGSYGDEDYSRALTAHEAAAIAHWRFEDAPDPERDAAERAEAEALRAAWFAEVAREREEAVAA